MAPQRAHGARCSGAPQALQNLDSAGLTCSQTGHSDRNIERCANPEGDFSIITHTPGSMARPSPVSTAAALRRLARRVGRLLTCKDTPAQPVVCGNSLQFSSDLIRLRQYSLDHGTIHDLRAASRHRTWRTLAAALTSRSRYTSCTRPRYSTGGKS
jgi:hypothetical protein